MDETPQEEKSREAGSGSAGNAKKWSLVSLAMEMGFVIALPLIAFALAGKWLDNKVHNATPWFTLLGILLAITSTTLWLVKRIKELIK